jgi:predicted transcriptional regulator
MAHEPDIDTLSTYYRTLRAPATKEGTGSSFRILDALTHSNLNRLVFDELREATEIPPVELAEALRGLQGLDLLEIDQLDDNEVVAITPRGKRLLSDLSE